MARHVVGKVSEIPEGGRVIVELQGRSVGIFHVNGRFYAVLNRCPHMGAEVCRGSLVGRLEADAPGKFRYSGSSPLLSCPWHGWEYDLETGKSYFESRIRPYPVGLESGDELESDMQRGEVQAIDADARGQAASGSSGFELRPGPYVAETFPISIEDEYVVVSMPGSGRRRNAPSAEASSQ